MRVFCRVELALDDVSADQDAYERIVSDDVDVALFIRDCIQSFEQNHGTAWEADIHLEPLTPREDPE